MAVDPVSSSGAARAAEVRAERRASTDAAAQEARQQRQARETEAQQAAQERSGSSNNVDVTA